VQTQKSPARGQAFLLAFRLQGYFFFAFFAAFFAGAFFAAFFAGAFFAAFFAAFFTAKGVPLFLVDFSCRRPSYGC
jgi:hypothetical protein